MSAKKLLMVFVKNSLPGYVKTRLAADVGTGKALEIYQRLLHQTLSVAAGADAEKEIWYSAFIEKHDEANKKQFKKKLQQGESLGERMKFSFYEAFGNGYHKVVIIGSDCPELTSDIVNEAFRLLDSAGLVIGPSEDGGYYLLGTSRYIPSLFEEVDWSTENVMPQTLEKAKKKSLSVRFLPKLNDVDTLEDLKKSRFFQDG